MKKTPELEAWRDPIVAEVRRAREELFAAAGHDLHRFCDDLRQRQEKSGHPLIRAARSSQPEPAAQT